MNDNFQSYTAYEHYDESTTAQPADPVRVHGSVFRATSNDGVMSESVQATDHGNTGELNPHHGDGSAFATARSANGSPVTEILASTLVEINGIQAPVSFWVSEGVLEKAADGSFREATNAPQAAPEASQGDIMPMAPNSMDAINAALEPIDQGHLESLIGTAMGTVAGRLSAEQFAQKFQQMSGLETADCAARAATIIGAYQSQANDALRSRSGIGAGDLPAFYAWARQNAQGALQEAFQKQVRQHDVSGYKAIAARWMATVPPSIAALKAAGHPVRMQGHAQEVFLRGQWMSPGAAAKAGLV